MKKRLFSAVLAVLLLFCARAAAFAVRSGNPGFFNIGSAEGVEIEALSESGEPVEEASFDVDGDSTQEPFFPGSSMLRAVLPDTEPGKQYLLLLTEAETGEILFVDQKEGGGELSFLVRFLLPEQQTELTLAVSSDAPGFKTRTIPLGYTPDAVGGAAVPEPTPEPWPDPADCPRDETCVLAHYSDLDRTAWYHDGIHFVLENGIMNGYDGGIFAPDGTTSRAKLVTILWHMAGRPAGGDAVFTDVPNGVWYTEAVGWAASVQLVAGYGNQRFGPNDPVTREQLAAILWRYAQYLDLDVGAGEEAWISPFSDAASVSAWAAGAMDWACAAGIIQGFEDGRINPRQNVTRAQVATMLLRFCFMAEA